MSQGQLQALKTPILTNSELNMRFHLSCTRMSKELDWVRQQLAQKKKEKARLEPGSYDDLPMDSRLMAVRMIMAYGGFIARIPYPEGTEAWNTFQKDISFPSVSA